MLDSGPLFGYITGTLKNCIAAGGLTSPAGLLLVRGDGMTIAQQTRPARRKPAAARERWTLDKQAEFLRHLADTANVTASARAVGMSEKGVYKLRMKSDAFRAAWASALTEGYVKLELMLLDRAMNGTRKAVWHGGKTVGETTEYSERLAMQLLSQHRTSVMTGAPRGGRESDADLRARLAEKLDDMSRRLEDG